MFNVKYKDGFVIMRLRDAVYIYDIAPSRLSWCLTADLKTLDIGREEQRLNKAEAEIKRTKLKLKALKEAKEANNGTGSK